MKRLTEYDFDGKIAAPKELVKDGCVFLCSKICNNYIDNNGEINVCRNCPVQKCFDKLAKYEDTEEQGRFIEFPVAVGDTVFVDREIVPCQQKYEQRFIEGQVVSLIKNNRGCQIKIKIIAKWQYSYWGSHIEDDALRAKYFTFSKNSLGITVFKSLEEAEAKLKELENEYGTVDEIRQLRLVYAKEAD